MDHERQRLCEAINIHVQSSTAHTDLPTENPDEAVHREGTHSPPTKEKKSSAVTAIYSSNSSEASVTDLMPAVSSSGSGGVHTSSGALQQVGSVSPAAANYQGGQGSAAAYSAGHAFLLPPGLPQLPQTPGFLTGAGYHLGPSEATLLGSQRFAVFPVLPPGQAGTALHFAAIVGDKKKLAAAIQDKNVNLEARDRWGRVALVFAVLGNHQECVELLLHAGAKPDALDFHRRTPLHFAAYKGHLGCMKAILHAAESRNSPHAEHCAGVWLAQDVRGVTPLHHAAVHNNHKCLQALLKYAVPGTLDTEDHKKRTPLHWAAAYGSQESVRLLIKHGANNLMPDQEGKTPLHWAAMSGVEGAKDCVRTLIGAAPSRINWQDFDGITALHLAVAEARKDTVDVILSVQNCNVALTDNQFRTALHWACSRGLSAIAALLMKRVSQVDAVDIYGATPLHYAAQHNHADCVDLLVRRQRARDIPSLDGHTSLMWAAAQGADSALAAMVRHGACLTQTDPRGCTALHIAAGAGHGSTVRLLLCLEAPPDVCANDGRTPVHFAARAGHTQIVKELAKAGASLQRRDEEGQCALHHAVLGGHLFLAQILIRAGTSVNVQDYYGRTPLHMAAYRGLSDIMFLLLENRGDVNARDFEGLSALHWAAEQGHLGAVNTLLDFHAYPNYTQSTPNRYTPYDCACVAEQLEVAQVLAEAGGISVTQIMEVAATRIQAAVRGHLTRAKLGKHRSPRGDQGGKTFTDEVGRVPRKPLTDINMDFTSNKLPHGHTVFEGSHASKHTRNTPSPILPAVDTSQASASREERESTSRPSVAVRSSASSEHSPYNSVSGQRRSKALPASIMRGAGKKTLRNLELPGLSELGVKQPRFSRSPEYSEDSDSGTDTTDAPRPLTAGILQHPGTTAAAAAAAMARGDSQQTNGDENSFPNLYWSKSLLLPSTDSQVRSSGPRSVGRLVGERRVLDEEAVKQAERKWKTKLASVTLQRVQGLEGGKAEVTLPYCTAIPHTHTPPAMSGKSDGSTTTTTTTTTGTSKKEVTRE